MSKTLRILYLGDIMGKPGRETVKFCLPKIRKKFEVDIVAAQAENVSHGKGMSSMHMRELQQMGVDFFTGGNHSSERRSLLPFLENPQEPVISSINRPDLNPKWGAKILSTKNGNVLFVSLLGQTFPETKDKIKNPLNAIDEVLEEFSNSKIVAKIVNFHGDFSSEKRVIGFYLDGRVSAVIGDHWHVPTADAMLLPGSTAHITDVGMCGTLFSSLGVTKETIITRWQGGKAHNEIDQNPPYQLNAVLVEVDISTGLSKKITQIQEVLEKLD